MRTLITILGGVATLLLGSCISALPSHSALDAVGSREQFLGRVAKIGPPSATERELFVPVDYEGGRSKVVRFDLARRNADFVPRIPSAARRVSLVEVGDASDPVPRGAPNPCLLAWKGGGKFWTSRVRWVQGRSVTAMNLPVYGSIAVHDGARLVFGIGEGIFGLAALPLVPYAAMQKSSDEAEARHRAKAEAEAAETRTAPQATTGSQPKAP